MNLLFSYVKKHKKALILALFLAATNQIFSLLDPQLFRIIIDRFASRPEAYTRDEFLMGIGLVTLASMGVAFVSRVAKSFQDYYVNTITQKVGAELYGQSVEHAFSLPYGIFEDQRSGELLQKLQKARTDAQALILSSVNVVFFSLVGILFVISYAFYVNTLIGLAFFLVIPTLGFTSFIITRKIKGIQKSIVAQTAELAGATTETLRNVELVKSLGLEDQETKRLNDVNKKILDLELVKVRMVRKFMFAQGTTINAIRSGIQFLMLWLIFTGALSLGEFMSLLFYSFFIFQPLGELGTVATQYQEASASMEQVEKVLALAPAPVPTNPKKNEKLHSVEFKNVDFAYESSAHEAVKGISIALRPGKTVAFVGPSGSGKSTLVKLLVGLYLPTKGELEVNGFSAGDIDYAGLRRRIGYVAQETQLFAGTIRENLLFVRPDATDAECIAALTASAALPIIEKGGKGLDTKIGEGGIKISGGERQRLAIARALLRDPELLIFDEATSSLDSLTEKSITDTIHEIVRVRPNTMTVLIAHRLATVQKADTIYVLEKGKVVEEGSHAELLKKGELYSALWREQMATTS